MTPRAKRALFALAMVLMVALFLELSLGLLAWLSPRVDDLLGARGAPAPHTVPDARLGHRPNPAYPSHDRNGFRNPDVPDGARIVALGDSQTYGTGVEPEEAWPRQLAAIAGTSVYGMACGGYGPAHGLVLMDEALAFSPAVVIEAFYAGNDLFDSFDLVYNRGQLPELKSADPDVRRRIAEAERKEPLADRAMRMLRMGTAPAPVRTKAPARVSAWEWIAGRSRIVGLFRALARKRPRAAPQPTPEQAWDRARRSAERHAGYCQILENGEIRTILTSEYRLLALDLGDARIEEGLRISLAAMRRMRERTAAKGIRFLVVLIPTKEAVFRDLCPNPSESYQRLVENEDRVRTLLKESLDRDGIEYADALPALRARLAAGIQPYPMSHDGHPNAAGHRAIAELVAALLVGSPQASAPADEPGR